MAPALARVLVLNKVRWALLRADTLTLLWIPDLWVKALLLRAGDTRTFLFVKNRARRAIN